VTASLSTGIDSLVYVIEIVILCDAAVGVGLDAGLVVFGETNDN
jgi:hypothetical protein